ncbi:UNVERIFIED_CONTAM: Phosphate transporter [Sesamum radiatum]|uniref:Phosphate transporter n=1 Tax=Sesamum radiatum TaxID=300843 RepID=A0AAW2MZ35_SESRA
MKFGKDLKKQKVPEWTEAYVDYHGLKRILQEIRNSIENKPNRPRASQKTLSLFMDFGASSGHASNLEKDGDIENQVIAVDKVEQENSRNLYSSKLLVSSEDGEENESIFFKTLDDELNKTNSFYKDKVDEAIGEAALLKKQMEALVALRIKVINPNFDGSSSLKCLSMDISNLAPSKIIPPARSKTVGG